MINLQIQRKLRICLLLSGLVLGATGSPPVFASDLSKFLNQLFAQEQQRQPTSLELNRYSEVYRQQGALEAYITFYSTDDYFISQGQRNLQVYVTRLYQAFLGRNPRPDELRFWVFQFQQPGWNRKELVRQFCQANHVTQLPSYAPSQPTFQVPGRVREISSELISRIDMLIVLVRGELGESRLGRRVVAQAQKLLSIAKQAEPIVLDAGSTFAQKKIVIDNLESNLQDLERVYYQIPGATSHSQPTLQQISQLFTALKLAVLGSPQRPPGTQRPPIPSRPPRPPVQVPEVRSLLESSRDLVRLLQRYQSLTPYYNSLFRDAQGLNVQVESVDRMIRQQQARSQIRNALAQVQSQANSISPKMRQVDNGIRNAWWNVQDQLRRALAVYGLSNNVPANPSQPVIVDRPSWGQLPYQPTPTRPARPNRNLVRRIDELTPRVDAYIDALRPMARRNGEVRRVVSNLRDLSHSALELRQKASENAPGRQVANALDSLISQYELTERAVTRMVATDASLNSPLFYQIGSTVEQIRREARSAQ